MPEAGQLWRLRVGTRRRVVVIETMGDWISWRWITDVHRQAPLRVDEWTDVFLPDEDFN